MISVWCMYDGQPRCACLFTGKERDTETGLDYFGARYYASNMGRFMSPDWSDKPDAVPYADFNNPQSLNLYGYVKNNPSSKSDPDGHCDVDGEHHGWVWCAAHVIGFTETAKETQTRLLNEANGFIAANQIGLISVNGQFQEPSASSKDQIVAWWQDYNKEINTTSNTEGVALHMLLQVEPHLRPRRREISPSTWGFAPRMLIGILMAKPSLKRMAATSR